MTTLVELNPRATVVAILVLFLGKYLTSTVALLREYTSQRSRMVVHQ